MFWAVLFLGFVAIGSRGVFLSLEIPKLPEETVSRQFASTDSWCLRLLGIPKASQRVLTAMEKIPANGRILLVCPDNPNSAMIHFLLSSLAWPRPFDSAKPEELGRIANSQESAPAAIMIYGDASGAAQLGGEQIGNVTLIRMAKP